MLWQFAGVGVLLAGVISTPAAAQYGLADGNFDSQGVAVGSYCYFPACPTGVWSGSNTGLIHSGVAVWGGFSAPSPFTMAFVQKAGQLTQTFTATGTEHVRLVWLDADRPYIGGLRYIVSVNGISVGTFTSSTASFVTRVSEAFDLIAGDVYTIAFTGQSAEEDRSSIIDSVHLVSAGSTTTYQYDSLGRLAAVIYNGGVNDGTTAAYSFDRSSNRTNVTVTGAAQ